jgi:hypothetical protein
MDKIFVLSSKESLKEFQKNPRRYISQPRPPCKLFVYGPRASSVEQVAQDLAKKYNATVSYQIKSKKLFLHLFCQGY